MDERERSIIAAHEAGHAVCGFVHGDKRRVEEISLFAHGEALGVTVSSSEDNDLPSETDLRARLVALVGGRVAEELLFHEVTGGASNDRNGRPMSTWSCRRSSRPRLPCACPPRHRLPCACLPRHRRPHQASSRPLRCAVAARGGAPSSNRRVPAMPGRLRRTVAAIVRDLATDSDR